MIAAAAMIAFLEARRAGLFRRSIRVILVEIQERLERALTRAGMLELAGPGNIFPDLASALRCVTPPG